jgi:hypothetical protein
MNTKKSRLLLLYSICTFHVRLFYFVLGVGRQGLYPFLTFPLFPPNWNSAPGENGFSDCIFFFIRVGLSLSSHAGKSVSVCIASGLRW